jgi:hypothetical protein
MPLRSQGYLDFVEFVVPIIRRRIVEDGVVVGAVPSNLLNHSADILAEVSSSAGKTAHLINVTGSGRVLTAGV